MRKLFFLALLCLAHGKGWAQSAPAPAATPTVTPSLSTPGTEWLFDAALGADMLQTLQIHRVPGVVESNVLLGQRPNEAQVVGYFVSAGIAHFIATRILVTQHVTPSIVQAWEAGTIGLEMAYVKHNASLGVHFYFP